MAIVLNPSHLEVPLSFSSPDENKLGEVGIHINEPSRCVVVTHDAFFLYIRYESTALYTLALHMGPINIASIELRGRHC